MGQQGKGVGDELYIEGRNGVREALEVGVPMECAWVLKGADKEPLARLRVRLAGLGVPVKEADRAALDKLSRTGHHQGIIVRSAAIGYSSVEDILAAAEARGEAPFLFMLDGIEDPHNLGAVIRTAEALGAHGVIVAKDRSAPLSEAVVRSSAGAVYHLPVARVTNLTRTIEGLKDRPVWFVCGDMGGDDLYSLDLKGPVCLVIGNEGKGVSRLVAESCDMRASIPMGGKVSSLNASVAAGILAAEVVRQRRAAVG